MPPNRSSFLAAQRYGQAGASLIEFSVVAVPILLLGLGSVDIASWFFTRQAVSLALLEAGRAGIVSHAHPQTMITAFEHALLPLFPAASKQASRQKLQNALHSRSLRTDTVPWQIEVLSPTPAAFDDFADPSSAIENHGALATINSNYQHEQDQARRKQGWAHGLGPASGVSIFQANTLVLRLSYLHEPALPGLKALLRLLGRENGSYRQHALARGYLPLVREIALGMQSHPVNWPLQENGKIIRPQDLSYELPGCTGALCAGSAPENPTSSGGMTTPNPLAPAPDSGGAEPNPSMDQPTDGSTPPGTDPLAVVPDDPACGITLCCMPS